MLSRLSRAGELAGITAMMQSVSPVPMPQPFERSGEGRTKKALNEITRNGGSVRRTWHMSRNGRVRVGCLKRGGCWREGGGQRKLYDKEEEERRGECRRRGDSMRSELANSVAPVLIVFKAVFFPSVTQRTIHQRNDRLSLIRPVLTLG